MYVIGQQEIEAVRRVVESGQLFRYGNMEDGHLNEVVQFEQEWAVHVGARHCVCTTSGSASLVCGLAALGIGPGDEVIIPGYTYIATALTVLNSGAIPVIVDVDESCTISPASVEKYISEHTRAIIPVHMMGMPCDMDAIMAIADKYGILVLEDACQSVGGQYKGRSLGTIGQAGAFSFNYYKIISAGESGAFVTNDKHLYERAFMQHDGGCHLWSQVQEMDEEAFAGANYRSNELAASVLRVQLQRLPDILHKLRAAKGYYTENIIPTRQVRVATCHDLEGDCGIQTLLTTDSEDTMRELMRLLGERLDVFTPIDTGRHVFANWKPIMNRKGAAHPLMDPFQMAANRPLRMDYRPDMLPDTLDVLSRSLMIRHSTTSIDDDIEEQVDWVNKAIRQVGNRKDLSHV